MLETPTSLQELSALEAAFKSIAQSVATSIVDALVQPLRDEIECRVNAIIADATKDVHAKIATALGQIQPINIPINLFAQPVVQPLIQPLHHAPQQDAPAVAESSPEVLPVVAEVIVLAPEQTLEAKNRDNEEQNIISLNSRGKTRTPKKISKNFAATIVGLLPGQAHMIKTEFKFAKLSFVSTDARNGSQLTSLSKNSNTVILMTDFIRHSSVESVRSVHGNWVYVTGGMSTLREKLRELYQQHQNKKG